MARPKFMPIETEDGWMVSIPGTMTGNHRRKRLFFPNKTEAEKHAAKLRTQYHSGQRSGVIPYELAVQAARAAAMLEPLGISLLAAAEMAVAAIGLDAGGDIYRDRYAAAMQSGEGYWSGRYAADMAKIPRWLPEWFMDTRCGSITPEMIRAALRECGATALSTQEARAARVRAILGHKPKHRKSAEISIMSDSQIGAMLAACTDDAEKWACALMIYAGIRPSAEDGEITRLDWEDVSETEIFVSSAVSKTNSERIIPVTPALARLIAGRPDDGSVIPSGWKRRYQRIRAAADISGGQDITRHTFASHFLAAFGEDKAKAAMGHTEGSRTLFRHYRRAITEEAGKAFFD